MHIKATCNMTFKLIGVRYVPSLKRNLISMGQLDDAGYAMLFKDDVWKMTKGSMVIMKGVEVWYFVQDNVEQGLHHSRWIRE